MGESERKLLQDTKESPAHPGRDDANEWSDRRIPVWWKRPFHGRSSLEAEAHGTAFFIVPD
ncbi:hypothetical protein, partial [Thermogutta sp.]|uniref:hypothetical protein n=1 Tax=Thermogutta sp. TaxID=1962930 RepID=UPI0025D4C8B8